MHLQSTLRRIRNECPKRAIPSISRSLTNKWETTNLTASLSQSRILNLDMIRLLGTIFSGLFGLAFGSFLNVCLSRWPEGESMVQPRSHCRHCGRTLAWWENVPLVSWLALRGRCRTCRAWIGCAIRWWSWLLGRCGRLLCGVSESNFRFLNRSQLGIVPPHIGFIPLIGTMFFCGCWSELQYLMPSIFGLPIASLCRESR